MRRLEGTAKSGKAWAVHFLWVAFDQVFRADLDGNGTQDYVVIGGSPYWNGRLAPPDRITVLLTDDEGLPVPFEAPLYDELGPRHVVDALHDGHARLALGAYDENDWDNRGSGCSGHWITALYEPVALSWRDFHGAAAEMIFPFVNHWTNWPECDQSPVPWKDFADTGKYATAGVADARASEICSSVVNGAIVYDQRTRREIALAAISDYREELLSRISAAHAKVSLWGLRSVSKAGDCTANLLWANK